MCACVGVMASVHMCVYARTLVPVHLNPVGGEEGRCACEGAGSAVVPSAAREEPLGFPAGAGDQAWGCSGHSLLVALSAETDAAAGALWPRTTPAPPRPSLLPLPTRSVSLGTQGELWGGRERLGPLETCQQWARGNRVPNPGSWWREGGIPAVRVGLGARVGSLAGGRGHWVRLYLEAGWTSPPLGVAGWRPMLLD